MSQLFLSKPGKDMLQVKERVITHQDSPEGSLFDERTTEYEDGVRGKTKRTLLLLNKSYSCRIHEDEKSGQLILVEQPSLHTDENGRALLAQAQPFQRLPWMAPERTYRLPALIDPDLTRVTKVEPAGPGLVRITFQAKPGLPPADREKLRGVTEGTLLLNERWHHRLEEADITYDPKQQHRSVYKVEYLDQPGREHLMRRMVSDTKFQMPGEATLRTGQQVWEFESLPTTDDPRIFYMSYYGLPEPEGVTVPSRPVPLWVWLLAGAGLLALAALVFRWLQRRRSRAAASPPISPTPRPAP